VDGLLLCSADGPREVGGYYHLGRRWHAGRTVEAYLIRADDLAPPPTGAGAGKSAGNGKPPPGPPPPQGGPRKPLDEGISLDTLMATDLPEPEFAVAGVIPQGLSILAARPKAGKSWLALQVAIAIAGGYRCLGDIPVRKAPVLYLALEDTRRRLKKRAGQILAALGWKPPAGLDLRVAWHRASSCGLVDLAEWFAAHPGGFAIVDTLARFRDPVRGKGNSYQEDYDAITGLKVLADTAGGAVKVIHHTRKGAADDPFDEVSGTLGVNGAADSILVLDRIRGQAAGTLYMTGRDLADETLTLSWNADGGVWTLAGRTDGVARLERPKEPTAAERCAAWLLGYLGEYAWPDKEVEAAAVTHGYTAGQLKRAKAHQRKAEPPLSIKPAGVGGEWWNWIGPKDERPPDRPTPHNPGGDTGESGDTEILSGNQRGRSGESGGHTGETADTGGQSRHQTRHQTGQRGEGQTTGDRPVSPDSPVSSAGDDAEGEPEANRTPRSTSERTSKTDREGARS
jgi:hypothetical protein